jgi:hypothetical protein
MDTCEMRLEYLGPQKKNLKKRKSDYVEEVLREIRKRCNEAIRKKKLGGKGSPEK